MTFPRLILLFILLAPAASTFAQEGGDPAARLDSYRRHNLQEKVFIHTDRTVYITGDHLWLRAYVVDGSLYRPLGVSRVVYVEILDANRQAVLQAKVPVKDGAGHTALFLPASLNSGNYTLRAYTRWMRNYSPDFFFHRTITVLNPFKPLGLQEQASKPDLDVQFFPEGGNLISGIEGKVAFRVVDASGHGLQNFKGYVMGPEGDTVATFSPVRFGLGSFVFTPAADVVYRAVITNVNGRVIAQKNLPQARPTGYALSVSDKGNGRIAINVRSNDARTATRPEVAVVIHTRLAALQVLRGRLSQGSASFEVDKADLGDGITHIIVFDYDNRPVCERLFFKRPENLLTIDAAVDRKIVRTREKVNATLLTADGNGERKSASLSVSVFRLDSLQSEERSRIATYLYLLSDLPGTIESPEYYFSPAEDAAMCADNLMLTHGWRRFTWQTLGDSTVQAFEPEYRGHLITGRLVKEEDGSAAPGIPVYLSVPGKRFHFAATKSRLDGRVIHELPKFYGPGHVIVQTDWSRDSVYRYIRDNPFDSRVSELYSVPHFSIDPSSEPTLLARSINMQLHNAYREEEKNKIIPPTTDTLVFYRNPDKRYYLDDYTRFGVMEEVMREYVAPIIVRKRKDDFYFYVLNSKTNEIFRDGPLVLVDGVPVFDVNSIMAFDPLKVWRLDVVASRYYYGKLTFMGIASYCTYTGDLAGFPVDKRAWVTEYDGLNWQREFYSPVYEMEEQIESRIPDHRTLLYWTPDVKTDAEGQAALTFYAGDLPGTYLMHIEGLTGDGMPGTTSLTFTVERREAN
jgi:hypothetical protein